MVAIMGIKVENRAQDAQKLQEILTLYGCEIQTRVGLHPIGDYKCNNYGIVLIEVINKINEIYDELSKFWTVQMMKF